ncbi:MAG: adenosylmethionine decarboxylase [Sedimentisphaerales bacterium]
MAKISSLMPAFNTIPGLAKKEFGPGLKVLGKKDKEHHDFFGRHFIANYINCDHTSLCSKNGLIAALKEAVAASGATLIKSINHSFTPSGFTALLLLSESHASIHTYPQFDSCFIDLFTCGQICVAEKFHLILKNYLKPEYFIQRVLIRKETIENDIFRIP